LGLAVAVAACQLVPRPFLPEGVTGARHKLLNPGAEANMLVMPVQGAPASRALAERVAEALRRQGVAAGTDAASRSSYAIWGMTATAGDAAPKLWLRWRLLDPNGMPAGNIEHEVAIDGGDWSSGTPKSMDAVAASAARVIVALIRGEDVSAVPEPPRAKPALAQVEKAAPPPAPVRRVPTPAGENAAAPKSEPPIPQVAAPQAVETAAPPATAKASRNVVIQWSGVAPGDGATALPRALGRALQGRKLSIVEAPGPGSYRLVGQLVLGPEKKGEQEIAVQWSLRRPDGASVATVSERSSVARGQLDRGWGELAQRMAEGSAGTLAALLRAAP
jgi:hypothetical protein